MSRGVERPPPREEIAARGTTTFAYSPVVDLWRVLLESPGLAGDEGAAMALLTPAERARAARFIVPEARLRFAVARAALRTILAEYLGAEPSGIPLEEGVAGKPELRTERFSPLHFNVTHAGALALIAVTQSGPVGVDVEQVREVQDADKIAARFFSPRERAFVEAAAREDRPRAFLRIWTRKEAVLKAEGTGLRALLPALDVCLENSSIQMPGSGSAAAWYVREIHPADGYVGAYALGRPGASERWHRLARFGTGR